MNFYWETAYVSGIIIITHWARREIIEQALLAVKVCEGYSESSAWGRLTIMV